MKGVQLGLVSLAVVAAAAALAATAASAPPALDPGERATLLSLREEEKLAHDVYVALARTSGNQAFLRIAAAETRHGLALERALAVYGIADPTDGLADGTFATAAFQDLYDRFVARGSTSPAAAYAVGVAIERQDVAELGAAIAATDEPLLDGVYASLRAGSQRHLAAFERQLTGCDSGAQLGPRGPRWAR